MDYILRYPLTFEDIEFLNTTSMDYNLHTPHRLSTQDSGWCDMDSGSYIVTPDDRAIFKDVSGADLTFLMLKFGLRLKELHNGMREIYNIAEQHNASPKSVIDGEMII